MKKYGTASLGVILLLVGCTTTIPSYEQPINIEEIKE